VTWNASAVKQTSRSEILWIWLGSRFLVLFAAAAGSWQIVTSGGLTAYTEIWRQWDTRWFESIAVFGYIGPYVSDFEDFRYNVAFFPGLPLIMDAGETSGLSPTLTGLIVSLFAGGFAATALARLGEMFGASGRWTLIAWALAPTALFVTAAYTEALFAAFAFWAWVVAKQGRWLLAGMLAGCAAFVRPNGLFLAVGLIVMFLVSRQRSWARGSALLIPFAVTGVYFAYLYSITGNWNAWSAAQSDFWGRELVDPVTALVNTYNLIFTFSPTGEPSSRMVTEIIAMVIVVAVLAITIVKKWWAEAAYVGVTALSLGTSTMYYSIPRTLVLMFPLWILIGLWLTKSAWLRWVYIPVGMGALIVVTILFTQGQWIS